MPKTIGLDKIQEDLHEIVKWFQYNGFKLSDTKADEAIILKKPNQKTEDPKLTSNQTIIKYSSRI